MVYSGPWRVVNSLTTLRLQLDAAFPERSHASDGTIADDAHSTASDHYPHRYPSLGSTPVVTAFDGTQDPAHGCDNTVITEAIRVSRDPRVKYVIWNRQMYSSYRASGYAEWTWRPYNGSDDPHTNHFHVSVVASPIADDTSPWQIGVDMPLTPEEYAEIVQGSLTNDNVMHYRLRSILDGADPSLSGYFAKGWTQYVGLKQLAERVDKIAADVAELKARPQVSATEVAAALVADPAFQAMFKAAGGNP
jgi:hypothetical protein